MTDVISKFFNYAQYEKRLSSHTVLAYQNDLRQFAEFIKNTFEEFDLVKVKSNHVRSWMIKLIEDKDTASTVNRKISCLKSFYKFLLRSELIEVNPTAKVIRPKMPKRLPKDVQQPKLMDVKDFLELNSEDDQYASTRDYAMFMVFYLCGIRRSELIDMTWDKVDLIQKQISVMGKGKKQRFIPMRSELVDILKRYKKIQEDDLQNVEDNRVFVLLNGKKLYPNFVYRTIQNHLANVSTQKGLGPHSLRHSFATHLLNEGAELNAIKELLGHGSLAATQVYTHNSIEKLKQVHKFSHPKS
jgi:integrase/recombinase XerC